MAYLKIKRRILVVDDNTAILKFYKSILSYEPNYEVETASSGMKALDFLESFEPNIILLDVMMPKMSGYEVCKTIRANPRYNNIWICFVSAKTELKDRLKGYDIGGDDYIVKPFEAEEIMAKLKAYDIRKQAEDISKSTSSKEFEKKSTAFFSNPVFTTMMYEVANFKTELIYIKTESPYCRFICDQRDDDYCRVRVSMKEASHYFKEQRLIQVHRSYLVNPGMIIDLKQKSTHDYDLLVKSNTFGIATIPVGRSYVKKLKESDYI